MAVNNPKYPHTCKVYRIEGATQFKQGAEVLLYEGVCRKESNTSIRNFYKDNVPKGDYRISIPGFVESICSGDMIDVTDRSRSYNAVLITECHVSNMGTELFINIPKN